MLSGLTLQIQAQDDLSVLDFIGLICVRIAILYSMALKTFVRVSGINNLSDARYCAGMEVNQLGFNIEANHSNYTDPEKFKELSEWLSGVEFVGELTDKTTDVAQCIVGYALDAIQIESLGQVEAALATGLPVSFIADHAEEAKEAWSLADGRLSYILIKSSEAGSIAAELPTLINDGFNAGDLVSILDQVQPKGIVLEGGNEIRPGYKDFDALADILELLEIDDLA